MRDGIYSFFITSDGTAIKGIALVENDAIRGFNRSHIYSVDQLVIYSVERVRRHRNTRWHVKAMEYTDTLGASTRGFPAKLKGDQGDDQFWFEGESDLDKNVRVEIQGAWLHNLPWHRATTSRRK
jgi:hypothetical protein